MAQAKKRQTSILVNPTGTPATKSTALAASSPFSNELHPLPPVHITADDVRQDRLPKTLMDLHESIRVATMPMRQDPESAPSYVRGVQFANNTANAAPVTVTFRHGLQRAPVSVTPVHSQGAPYQGYSVDNPNGSDPTQYATITTSVPANTVATHDFKLASD
jgi:hypothetical protein